MNIGIIGTGNIGSTLGRLWAGKGHRVFYGSRSPEKAKTLAKETGQGTEGGSQQDAVAFGDIVLLAVPWDAAKETMQALDLAGKTLIDCVNPLAYGSLDIGHTTSAAEEIAGWAPDAKVVKAFNSIHYKNIAAPDFQDHKASIFYCGDDNQARQQVRQLIEDIGLDPVDSGPLSNARLLEPLAMLWIDLAFQQKQGVDTAWALLKR